MQTISKVNQYGQMVWRGGPKKANQFRSETAKEADAQRVSPPTHGGIPGEMALECFHPAKPANAHRFQLSHPTPVRLAAMQSTIVAPYGQTNQTCLYHANPPVRLHHLGVIDNTCTTLT